MSPSGAQTGRTLLNEAPTSSAAAVEVGSNEYDCICNYLVVVLAVLIVASVTPKDYNYNK